MKIKSIKTLNEHIPTYDFEVKNKHHYLLDNWCVSHNTSLVIGTTASVMPIYKKYFVETNSVSPTINVAPNLNSKNFWFYKESINMNLTDVIDMMSVIYKWIDQSISFEFLINPAKVTPKDISWYYFKCWEEKIKTVYYVRSMNLDVKECVSCSG